jgi:hypothetical protein
MNYYFKPKLSGEGRVVLKLSRSLQVVLSIILLLLGIPVFPAGLLLFLGGGPDIYAPFFWTGMGLLFLVGGLMTATQLRIPEYIIFDNKKGDVIIKEKTRGEWESAIIPYGDIEGFQVRYHASHNYGSHVVEMKKKDGAFWTIYSDRKESKAVLFRDQLARSVNLEAGGGDLPGEEAPRKIEVIRGPESTSVQWKRSNSLAGAVLGNLAVLSMAMVIYGARPIMESEAAFYVGAGFIGFITILMLFHTIDALGRKHVLEITHDGLTYYSKGGITKGPGYSIPFTELDSVIFNFSTTQSEMAVYLLRKGEKALFQSVKRGSYAKADFFKALTLMRKIRKVDVGQLSTGDRIRLEALLQNLIHEKSGISGL